MIRQTVNRIARPGFCRLLPVIVVGSLLTPFALGISPVPSPYHRYEVNGRVRTPAGAPVQGIILIAFARTAPDSVPRLAGSTGRADDLPLGVTSADGSFALSIRTDQRAESLALGMTAPGKALVLSPAFHPDTALAWPVKKTATSMDERGCSGCGTGPSSYEYVEYYRSNVSQDIILPDELRASTIGEEP